MCVQEREDIPASCNYFCWLVFYMTWNKILSHRCCCCIQNSVYFELTLSYVMSTRMSVFVSSTCCENLPLNRVFLSTLTWLYLLHVMVDICGMNTVAISGKYVLYWKITELTLIWMFRFSMKNVSEQKQNRPLQSRSQQGAPLPVKVWYHMIIILYYERTRSLLQTICTLLFVVSNSCL